MIKRQVAQRARPVAVLAAVAISQIHILTRKSWTNQAAVAGRAIVQADDPGNSESATDTFEGSVGFDQGRGTLGEKQHEAHLHRNDLDGLVPRIKNQDFALES